MTISLRWCTPLSRSGIDALLPVEPLKLTFSVMYCGCWWRMTAGCGLLRLTNRMMDINLETESRHLAFKMASVGFSFECVLIFIFVVYI